MRAGEARIPRGRKRCNGRVQRYSKDTPGERNPANAMRPALLRTTHGHAASNPVRPVTENIFAHLRATGRRAVLNLSHFPTGYPLNPLDEFYTSSIIELWNRRD
jgi:hypothetical protein